MEQIIEAKTAGCNGARVQTMPPALIVGLYCSQTQDRAKLLTSGETLSDAGAHYYDGEDGTQAEPDQKQHGKGHEEEVYAPSSRVSWRSQKGKVKSPAQQLVPLEVTSERRTKHHW